MNAQQCALALPDTALLLIPDLQVQDNRGHARLTLGRAVPHTPHYPDRATTLPLPEAEPNSQDTGLFKKGPNPLKLRGRARAQVKRPSRVGGKRSTEDLVCAYA